MKVTFNRMKLVDALKPISVLLNSRNDALSASFNQVLFQFTSDVLFIYSTDGTYSIKTFYGVLENISTNFKCLVEGPPLISLLSLISTEELDADFQEDRVIVYADGNIYKFMYYVGVHSHLALFERPYNSRSLSLEIGLKDLSEIIQFLSYDIAKDVSRSFLSGIYYDGNFVATDGVLCGIVPYTSTDTPLFFTKGSLDLIKALSDRGVCKIFKQGNLISVEGKDFTLRLPQVTEKFVDYSVVHNKRLTYPFSYTFETTPLLRSIQRLLPFSDRFNRHVGVVTFEPTGTLVLQAQSAATKEGYESILSVSGVYPQEKLTFRITLDSFLNLVSTINTDKVILKFSDTWREPLIIQEDTERIHYHCWIESKS